MPRPSKLAEEVRKQAWAAAHPESSAVTKARAKKTKSRIPQIPLEGTVGLLLEIAVLILGHLHVREPFVIWGLFIIGLVLISDWVIRSWAPSRPKRSTFWKRRLGGMVTVATLSTVIAIFISQSLKVEEQAAKSLQGKGATLDNVHINAFGSAGIVNQAGQLNFKNSSVSNDKVGIDNRNPNAQINFDNSHLDGNGIGVINRAPGEKIKEEQSKEEKPKPSPKKP